MLLLINCGNMNRCHESYGPGVRAHRTVYKLLRHAMLRISCFIDLTVYSVLVLLGRTPRFTGRSVSLHRFMPVNGPIENDILRYLPAFAR